MDVLDPGFRSSPVAAELLFAAHGLLRFAQCNLVPLETVEWSKITAIGERSEAGNAHVDSFKVTIYVGS